MPREIPLPVHVFVKCIVYNDKNIFLYIYYEHFEQCKYFETKPFSVYLNFKYHPLRLLVLQVPEEI